MIRTKDGTPLGEALQAASIRVAEQRARRPGRRYLGSATIGYPVICKQTGRAYDKLGDAYRVFREIVK